MSKSRIRVVIVGGGIGGLFAANALLARGMNVSLYEQGPALESYGARVGPRSRYYRHDGTPIAPVQVTDSSGWNANFGMHRADFVELLSAALPEGVVHTGHRCIGFEQDDETARVKFANG